MKIFSIIQEEMNKIQETPDGVSADDVRTDVSDSNAYPFAYNIEMDTVDVGEEATFHSDNGLNKGNGYIYPGRIWLDDKIMGFWTYPNNEEFKKIIPELEDHFGEQIMNNGWRVEVYPDLKKGTQDYNTNIWNSNSGPQLVPVEEYSGSKDVSEILKNIHAMSPADKPKYKKMYNLLKQQKNRLDHEQLEVLKVLEKVFSYGGGSHLTSFDQPNNMKYRQAIRQEGEDLDEGAAEIEYDGKYIYYREAGTFPFAVYKKTGEVFMGQEEQGHGSSYVDIEGDGDVMSLRQEGVFHLHGRLFSDQKVLAFWGVPTKGKLKQIIDQINQKTNFNLYDGEWRIQLDVPYTASWEEEYMPITDYFGMDTPDMGGKTSRIAELLEKIHTMSPAEKPKFKQIYLTLKQQKDKLDHEQMQIYDALDKIFSYGGGSKLTAFDQANNMKYRKALRQESDRKWHGDGVEEIIDSEIQSLQEDPDTLSADEHYVYYRDMGTYPFGMNMNTGEVEVGEESQGHSDAEFDDGEGTIYTLSGSEEDNPFDYLGRLFSDQKVITLWSHPDKAMLKDMLEQIQQKTDFNFYDGEWEIEAYHDGKGNRGEFLFPLKQYLGMEDTDTSDIDELMKIIQMIHTMPPSKRQKFKEWWLKLKQTPKENLKPDDIKILAALESKFGGYGGGSKLTSFDQPNNIQARQARQTSEGEELEESPDNLFIDKDKSFSYGDLDSRAFGYINNEMHIGEPRGIHPSVTFKANQSFGGRNEMKYAGRVWTDEKLLSFWEYPKPNEIKRVLKDLGDKLGIVIDDSWKIQTLIDVEFDKDREMGMDWENKNEYKDELTSKLLSPSEYEQLGSVGQRSAEELAKDHVASPLQKPHREPIQGGGSSKYGTQKPLAYRQALVRSEGLEGIIDDEINLQEDPDNVYVDDESLGYVDDKSYAFGYDNQTGEMKISYESGTHSDIGGRDWVNNAGRIWNNDKIISFWEYPEPNQIRKVLSDLGEKLHIRFNDSWKIETVENYENRDLANNVLKKYNVEDDDDFLTPTEYEQLGSVGQRSAEEMAKDHLVSPLQKSKRPVQGGGSQKTAWDQPNNMKYRQAIRQEGINDIVNDEVSSYLQEDPDTSYHPEIQTQLGYSKEGAYAFGYTDDGEFMVSYEGGTHGDLENHRGNYFDREGVRYGGRIWTNDGVMSFWEYPEPNMIRDIAQDLENELGTNIINNPDFVIETLVDAIGEDVWDEDDEEGYKDDSMHWAWGEDVEFLTVPEYEKLGAHQIQQRSPEELAKQHVDSPMNKPKRAPIKGSGSSKYGREKPLAYRQALMRSEGELHENPDVIHRDGEEYKHGAEGAYGFGYSPETGQLMASERTTHGQLIDTMGNQFDREELEFPGRIWTYEKHISFWKYPSPSELQDVIHDLNGFLNINIDDTWTIETLTDTVGKGDEHVGWDMHWVQTEEKPVYLTPSQYKQLGSVGQRSAEELGQGHIDSPLDKTKRPPIHGSGSSKYGTDKPLAYRQALMRSEGEELEESPDEINFPDGDQLSYHVENAYAFGYYNGEMRISDANGTHGDIAGSRSNMQLAGRIWKDQRMISFWEYPQPSEIRQVLKDIGDEMNIQFDDSWSIETLPDKVDDREGRGAYSDWQEKEAFGYEPSVKNLSPTQYEQLGGVGQRSKEELEKDHVLSPMLRSKKPPIEGAGSSKYGTQKPLAYRQALVRSEGEDVYDELEGLLSEWSEDQMYDIYDMRDEIMRETLYDWLSKPYGTKQPWTLVPFGRLKKIWEDAAKMGVVRDTKGLDIIQSRMIRNLLKLDVNTEIMGHSTHYPEDEIEDLGYTMEQFHEKNDSSEDEYFEDGQGQWRLSDYGLEPLWKIAQKLVGEEDDIRRIMYMDQMLNVIHMRSDMAGNFVEGGSAALSQLSGEHAEVEEGLNEKLEGDFQSDWYKKKPIEIYSNPKSIKRMDGDIRGIVDREGNVFVANIGAKGEGSGKGKSYASTTHSEIIDFLKKKGLITVDNNSDTVQNVGIHRVGKTNDFYLGESNSYLLNYGQSYQEIEEIFAKAKEKNPTMNFVMKDRWDAPNSGGIWN